MNKRGERGSKEENLESREDQKALEQVLVGAKESEDE